jgi:hypothetical protein
MYGIRGTNIDIRADEYSRRFAMILRHGEQNELEIMKKTEGFLV